MPAAGLLAPDEDLAVVGRGGEDVAVLWVCPCYAPDSALVPTGVSIKFRMAVTLFRGIVAARGVDE